MYIYYTMMRIISLSMRFFFISQGHCINYWAFLIQNSDCIITCMNMRSLIYLHKHLPWYAYWKGQSTHICTHHYKSYFKGERKRVAFNTLEITGELTLHNTSVQYAHVLPTLESRSSWANSSNFAVTFSFSFSRIANRVSLSKL